MKHYSIKAITDKNVISEVIRGYWTEDIAYQYLDDFKQKVLSMNVDEWVLLTDLTEWKTSDQKIVDIIGEHFEWNRNNGMKLNANVLANPLERSQLRKMFEAGKVDDICKVFATRAAAVLWLKSNGFG